MLKTIDPKLRFVIDEVKRRFNVTLRPPIENDQR